MASRRNVTYSNHPDFRARQVHARGDRQFRTYDTSYIQPKKSKKPVFIVILILIIVALAVFGVTRLIGCGGKDLLPKDQKATITVAQGEGAGQIGIDLEEARLVSDAKSFTKYVTKHKLDSQLKPGTYTFFGGTSIDAIAEAMVKGPMYDGAVLSVPEGSTLKAIANSVASVTNGRISADSFIDAASDASKYAAEYPFLEGAGTASLEGFLFPKTYGVSDTDTADSVIRKMLDQFETETASLDFSYAKEKGLSEYEALILASIVEKEGTAETRAAVAGVFYNRLTRVDGGTYGYLQSDATTAYELGREPTAEDVHADTPYGTYANPGLPPTPICSPGLESLQDVCNPEENDYFFFYFVPDSNGNLQYFFSETYDEHQQAIYEN